MATPSGRMYAYILFIFISVYFLQAFYSEQDNKKWAGM
jgi:hypothetical protein